MGMDLETISSPQSPTRRNVPTSLLATSSAATDRFVSALEVAENTANWNPGIAPPDRQVFGPIGWVVP